MCVCVPGFQTPPFWSTIRPSFIRSTIALHYTPNFNPRCAPTHRNISFFITLLAYLRTVDCTVGFLTLGPKLDTPPPRFALESSRNFRPSDQHYCYVAKLVPCIANIGFPGRRATPPGKAIWPPSFTGAWVGPNYGSTGRVGNSSLLGHCPFGLDVNLIFKGTEASWEGTKATFHPSPGAPRPV